MHPHCSLCNHLLCSLLLFSLLTTQAPKPAVLANGRTVKVTRFVNNGDLVKIKVDGEEFVSRATEEEAKAYQERYLSKTIMRG